MGENDCQLDHDVLGALPVAYSNYNQDVDEFPYAMRASAFTQLAYIGINYGT